MTTVPNLIVYPVSDLPAARTLYARVSGVEPYVDAPYYVGFRTGTVEIGLDPHGHQSGLTGPVAYWEVGDLDAAVAGLVESGAELRSPAREVGGGKRVAVLADPDGNLTGLSQTA